MASIERRAPSAAAQWVVARCILLRSLGDGVLIFQSFAKGRDRPADMAVLSADQATQHLIVVGSANETPSTEYVEFTFTDARGARWRRLGSAQPEQQLELKDGERPT